MPFEFEQCEIPEVILVKPRIFQDERGQFLELYKATDFKANGVNAGFVQINQSTSRQNVLRGLHYQNNPKAQGKLVTVTKGEIFDVAVDIRKGSPMYGKWVGRTLDAATKHMLFIPAGFAHGFCVLSEEADITYYCTEEYSPGDEGGIIWNDPTINIEWPVQSPLISQKDLEFPGLEEAKNNFTV